MGLENPPLHLQSGSHPAVNDRRFVESLLHPGVFSTTDLVVSERNTTPNMSVDISTGSIAIPGSENAEQGTYFCASITSVVNLTVAASDATNARKDLVVASVKDSAYSGGSDEWELAVVTGTPAATPAHPSVPANSVVLSVIDVPALSTSVVNANLTDVRYAEATATSTVGNRGTATALGGTMEALSAYLPNSAKVGQRLRELDTGLAKHWDGSSWIRENGVWIPYTPTVTGLTFTSPVSRFMVLDDTVTYRFLGTVTGTSAAFVTFVLPVAAESTYNGRSGHGVVRAVDVSALIRYEGDINFDTTSLISVKLDNPSTTSWHGTLGNPFVFAAGDTIDFTFTYERS